MQSPGQDKQSGLERETGKSVSQPPSLTLESIDSCGLGKAGSRDHRALELEEIFVTCYLREKKERLGRWRVPAIQEGLATAIQQTGARAANSNHSS